MPPVGADGPGTDLARIQAPRLRLPHRPGSVVGGRSRPTVRTLVLDEADIEEPVVFEGGTSSRLHPLERPKSASC